MPKKAVIFENKMCHITQEEGAMGIRKMSTKV